MSKTVTKGCEHPYPVGKNVFIRGITMYYVGRLLAVYAEELVLESASWVADTGRFHQAMMTGSLSEVEPFAPGPVIVGRGSVVDCVVWTHPLPTSQR